MTAPIPHLVEIATLTGLTPVEAVILPACIERAALKVNMTAWSFANRCLTNRALADYIASVCKQLAPTI